MKGETILDELDRSPNLFLEEKAILKIGSQERISCLIELGLIERRTTVSGQVLYALKERLEAVEVNRLS